MSIDPGDYIAIHQLLNLYGHVFDERQWSRFPELFTDDVVIDFSSFGAPPMENMEAARTFFVEVAKVPDGHTLAHHATNIYIERCNGDEARVLSKGVSLRHGVMGSTVYRDILRRTPAGWRIARRTCTARSYETIPEAS